MTAELVSLALALGLGLLAGIVVGARAGLRLAERRRADLATQAHIARMWPGQLPRRTAADILAGIIRVSLGGHIYMLPVLPRGAARRWLETLDRRFANLGSDLEQAGDDTPAIMVRLVAETDALLDLLLAYDRAGNTLLPDRADLDEVATDTEILRAVLEVWRAVNPLADTLAGLEHDPGETTAGIQPVPPTTPPAAMAGAQASSTASPTNSSSRTSTPPRTASSASRATSSNGSSRRSVSGRASSTTPAPTDGGGRASGHRAPSRQATAEG